MDEILAGINSTITDIELVSDDTRKAINDTFTSGVQEIEFYKFSMEVKFFFSISETIRYYFFLFSHWFIELIRPTSKHPTVSPHL